MSQAASSSSSPLPQSLLSELGGMALSGDKGKDRGSGGRGGGGGAGGTASSLHHQASRGASPSARQPLIIDLSAAGPLPQQGTQQEAKPHNPPAPAAPQPPLPSGGSAAPPQARLGRVGGVLLPGQVHRAALRVATAFTQQQAAALANSRGWQSASCLACRHMPRAKPCAP